MSDKVGVEEIRELVDWLNQNGDVQEFSLKYGELELFMSRVKEGRLPPPAATAPAQPAAAQPAPAPVPAPAEAPPPAAPPVATAAAPRDDEVLIKAPMVGTFYASPKPGAPPFVQEGQAVTADSVVCIIEVMKLMQSIQAGQPGVVVKVFVGNGEAVQYGQPLVLIRKS